MNCFVLFPKTGSFGQVFYGVFTSESDQRVMEVAIKTIKGTNLYLFIICMYDTFPYTATCIYIHTHICMCM